jgi:type IV secretory pathway TraG/TraD family ATPase VirD4
MKRIEDERIITEKRKINSKAFGICFLALWGILIYRQFVLHQNIIEYIDVFLLTIGISIYVTINNVFKGFYLTYRKKNVKKKVNLIGALVGSTTFVIVQFFIMNYELTNWMDIIKLLLSFLIFLFIWIVSQSLLMKISEKEADKDVE